ncbi:MAG: ABC transporter permease subunit [Phycisphaerales bacterium]|nr:ABC transporter permease subunit [Phycisphaerales bacterium]
MGVCDAPCQRLDRRLLINRLITIPTRHLLHDWSHQQVALWQLGKFVGGCVLTVIVALLLSHLLNAVAWDPRGSFVGTYIQRNAMIVGFVMGFAIIPIIYTISEDALSSVPEHLRAASLAAGATPWQTAMRIIVPTAASGLFSAAMIGLGRAVGETMIVLMAAGNTPVMDWNIFNGFRTLSANIAVELPEAVKDSTHYRMLFLAGFVLFVMTFLLNTVAEVVRQRFRKRAFQL